MDAVAKSSSLNYVTLTHLQEALTCTHGVTDIKLPGVAVARATDNAHNENIQILSSFFLTKRLKPFGVNAHLY